MTPAPTRDDLVAEGFGRVADAFRATIADDGPTGAALSVWIEGRPVVELAGGRAGAQRDYGPDTLTKIFSCTKGVASVLVAVLIERGLLPGFDVPLAAVWPEFGARGKDRITIGDALAHRAGLSALREDLPREDALDDRILAAALAAQEPLWEPGRDHMYHAATHGAITAELVRRATGRSIGRFLQSEAGTPLGADIHIGLAADEDHRVATILPPEPPAERPAVAEDDENARWLDRAMTVFGRLEDDFNDPAYHRGELAGMGGVATASGLARFWSATVVDTSGVRLLQPGTVDELRARRSAGPGRYGSGDGPFQEWGAGVMTPCAWDPYLSPSSFGHDGAGGQVSFADIDARVGFAYLTNEFGDFQRGISVVEALRAALDR